MTKKDWLKSATDILVRAKINSLQPRLDAEIILAFVLGVSRTQLHIISEASEIDKDLRAKADNLIELRSKGYPIAYITGVKEFYGYDFIVTPDVLIPRPETENLVSHVLRLCERSAKDALMNIIDVGSGPGTIGLTVGLELEKRGFTNYQITLSDISEDALKICQKNRDNLGVLNTNIVRHNLLENSAKSYDFILANLPYVDRQSNYGSEIRFEPEVALFSDQHGLKDITNLVKQVAQQDNLRKDGWLLLESDISQKKDLHSILENTYYFTNISDDSFITLAQRKTA